MMNIDKKELKQTSYEFRSKSSRLLSSNYDSFTRDLDRFINFVENEELIYNFIRSFAMDNFNIEDRIKEDINNNNKFNIGDTEKEEIYTIYYFLKYCIEKSGIPFSILMKYGNGSNKYNDMIKNFNDEVSLILINHIEDYLNMIKMEMGYDEEMKYNIHMGNNGQVNIAEDKSTINAVQNNNSNDLEELSKEIKEILRDIDLDKEIKENIEDNVEVLESELLEEKPRKGFIRTAIDGLQNSLPNIKDHIELTANITSIIGFAMAVIK